MKYQMDLFGGVPDYYKVIGAKQSDPQKDIMRKCNEKVAEYHPDKQGSNEDTTELFQRINKAYEVLGKEKVLYCYLLC